MINLYIKTGVFSGDEYGIKLKTIDSSVVIFNCINKQADEQHLSVGIIEIDYLIAALKAIKTIKEEV